MSLVDELVPSRYAVQVGDVEVMVISDGVLPITASTMATNAPPADLSAWLKDMYLPPEIRESFKVDLIEVEEPGTYKYFEALHQDYVQMPRQQLGLRNNRLDHMSLVKEEVVIAHYHSVMDRFMNERG